MPKGPYLILGYGFPAASVQRKRLSLGWPWAVHYIVHEKQRQQLILRTTKQFVLDDKAYWRLRQVVVIDKAYVDHLERHQPYSARYIYIIYWLLQAPFSTNHDCQRSCFPSVSRLCTWIPTPFVLLVPLETQFFGYLPLHTKPSPLNSPPAYLFFGSCSTRHFLRRG